MKYTWAPQTVHNTPVMNILKGYFYIGIFYKKHIKETKVKFKISSSIVNAYRRQVQSENGWTDGEPADGYRETTLELDL